MTRDIHIEFQIDLMDLCFKRGRVLWDFPPR